MKELLQKIDYLPTLPVIAQQVLQLANDDMTSTVSLEEIIDKDIGISSKILHIANSAYFGFNSSVKTIREAIMRIGFSHVKDVALGVSLMSVFDNEKGKKILDYERIFKHSVSVGVVAKLIAKEINKDKSVDFFIIGLLHDIGLLALCNYFLEEYDSVMYNFHCDDNKSLLAAESQILKTSHAEVGSWLAETWYLDKTVIDATRFHHCPSSGESNLDCVAIVHLADYYTSDKILSATKKNPLYELDKVSLEILELSEKDFANLKPIIESQIPQN